MKHKITITVFKILFGFFIMVLPVNDVFGQTIDPVILVGGYGICASSGSKHNVRFSINESTGVFPTGTIFTVQLSDDLFTTFTNGINPIISSPSINERIINFELPSNFVGSDNYKIRIATSTGYNSVQSQTYYAYFRPYINTFTIFGGQSQTNICLGGNITLTIDPSTTSPPYQSPLDFPNLKYIWEKKQFASTTYAKIIGATGISYTVTSEGDYRARIDYGTCEAFSLNAVSQPVRVTQAGNGSSFTIASTLPNPICSGSPTTLSVTSGFSYQWFKNTVPIAGATNSSYTTDQPGFYYVTVNGGSCVDNSNIYEVQVAPISATIDALTAPQVNIVLSGESLAVTASSTATSPTYQWYFEGTPVSGQTSNTFTVIAQGNYSVIVTENTTCLTSEEVKFILKNGIPSVNIPNAISPNNDGINDTWIIPQKYLSGSKTEIQILSAQGKVEFTTNDYKNDWPTSSIDFKNTNPIYYYIITTANQETKMGSITVIK